MLDLFCPPLRTLFSTDPKQHLKVQGVLRLPQGSDANGISSIPEHWTDQLNAASDVDALIQISPAIKTLP